MRKNIKLQVFTALVMSASAIQVQAAPFESELRNVLEVHPAIKAARLASQASQDRVAAAKGAYYPRLSLSGDMGKEDITTTSYTQGVPSSNPVSTDLNRKKMGVVLEQSLFNGGRREVSVELAGIDSTLQSKNYDAQVQDVLLEAIAAYLQVARYQTLIGLSKLNEETTQRQLELENKRVKGGAGIAVDVLQARSRLQIVRERRVFYEQGLRDAAANYEQVFGRPPVLADIQDFGALNAKLPSNIVVALERGMASNPRLKATALQVERAKKSIELEKSAFAPTVDLVATQAKERDLSQLARKEEKSLLLKFNWVLFSGGDTTNRTAAAVKDREEQEARESIASNKTKEMIRINWNQLVNGSERLELLDSAATIAKDVMEDRKRLRDAGKESAIIVLDAEVEYYGVLANKVNALYDTKIGSYKLMASLGELTPEALWEGGKFAIPVKPLAVDLAQIAAPIKKR